MSRAGLCPECARVRIVRSARGSAFLLCKLAAREPGRPKYPPQPVRSCSGFQPAAAPPASERDGGGRPR